MLPPRWTARKEARQKRRRSTCLPWGAAKAFARVKMPGMEKFFEVYVSKAGMALPEQTGINIIEEKIGFGGNAKRRDCFGFRVIPMGRRSQPV